MARYFKIEGKNEADKRQLISVLSTFDFYPTKQSTPPIPDFDGGAFDKTFDFRQFWLLMGIGDDNTCIVYTRKEVEESDFEDMVPEEEWEEKNRLSDVPNFIELTKEEYWKFTHPFSTNSFLSYSYPVSVFYTPD